MGWTPSNTGGAGTASWTVNLTNLGGWTYTTPPAPDVKWSFAYVKGNGSDSVNVTVYGMYRTGPSTFKSVNIQNFATAGNTPTYTYTAGTIPPTNNGNPLDHIVVTNAGGVGGAAVTNPPRYFYPPGHPLDPTVPPNPPATGLIGVLEDLAGGVLTPGEYGGNALDLAQDLADRSGKRISDDGYGTYKADPWPDATGTPVLTVSAGTNLIDSGIGLDIDTSGFAQQVKVSYYWETPNPDYAAGKKVVFEDGTVGEPYRAIGHLVEAVSSPSRGPRTLTVERKDIPVTQAQAQAAANALGARAWARGRSLSVTCPVAWWVQPLDTVRVHLPYGPATDYLVSTVRHDSKSGTTTMTLRGPTLIMNPPQA